jgi:chromosome partitioning protein
MRRIAFINEKGGTGKTTLAVNVAAWLAERRRARVLLVDLDTQGHAGKSLGLDVRTLERNAFHWLTDPAVTLSSVVRETSVPGLTALPAYKEMADFPLAVASSPGRDRLLADRLSSEASGYDFVVFDAPPSLGLTTRNILLAASEVVVPVALTYLSLDGCAEVVHTVEEAAERSSSGLHVSRVVPTHYRRTALADAILEKLHTYFPGRVSPPLGFNVRIDEAQSHGKTIWQYAPRSRGAEMLAEIARDILRASPDELPAASGPRVPEALPQRAGDGGAAAEIEPAVPPLA